MKTLNKTFYVCEICGRTSQDGEKIAECQAAHKDVESAEVEPVFSKGAAFPRALKIMFAGGATAIYFIDTRSIHEGG